MKSINIQGIIAKLRNEDERWDAILELKLLHDRQAVPELVKLLEDKDWLIRWSVAEKLGDLRDARALPALAKCLADADRHVVRNAYKAIQKYGSGAVSVIVPYFEHKESSVRNSVYSLIKEMGAAAIPAMEKIVFALNPIVASRIVHTIWAIQGPMAEKTLIQLLDVPNLRRQIIVLLGQMKSAGALPKLLGLYSDPKIKKLVLVAFKNVGEDKFFDFIIRSYLYGEKNSRLRALEVIQKVGKFLVPSLIKKVIEEPKEAAHIFPLVERLDMGLALRILEKNAPKNRELTPFIKELKRKSAAAGVSPAESKGIRGFIDELFGK